MCCSDLCIILICKLTLLIDMSFFDSLITASKRPKDIKRNSGGITLHILYSVAKSFPRLLYGSRWFSESVDRNLFDSLELIKEKTIFDLRVPKN